jgi:hypothetical protein
MASIRIDAGGGHRAGVASRLEPLLGHAIVPTYLTVFICISVALMLFGYAMDRAMVDGEIKGSNGLPIFLMTELSMGVWAIAAVVSIFLSGWGMFFLILFLTKPFNFALLKFLVWRLETVGRRKTTIRAELAREMRTQFKSK